MNDPDRTDPDRAAADPDDPVHARATAAADALVAGFGDLDTDAALQAVRLAARADATHRRLVQRRWMASAAAGVLVIAGTMALALVAGDSRSGDTPAPVPPSETTTHTPVVPTTTTTPGFTTTTPPSTTTTSPSTTTTQPAAPTGPVASVSYLDPPPVVGLTPLATIDAVDAQSGGFAVGIGDVGVVVSQWPYRGEEATRLDVVGFDGRARRIPNVDAGALLAVGPGDVAYLSRTSEPIEPPLAVPAFAIVAVALAGDPAGTTIASWPANIHEFLEYPPLSFGHGADGIVHRRYGFDEQPAFAPHVDTAGAPVRLDPVPPRFAADWPGGLGGIVRSSAGGAWTLVVEPAPERTDTFDGSSPAAPGPDGRGVYVTHLGNAAPGTDFGEPTMWVVAELRPDGTATWWSLPDGWTIVASDAWGTVAARHDGTRLELALVDFA